MQFIALMPSPLGRVAEHSEDGRGTVKCYVFACIYEFFVVPAHLFRHALRHATFPRGEGETAR